MYRVRGIGLEISIKVRSLSGLIFLLSLTFLVFKSNLSNAQELVQVVIHSNEALYVHPVENIGIFSDLKNSGTIGAVPKSVINFYGQRWSNKQGANLVDESSNGMSGQGGSFRFQSLTNSPQFIENENLQANNAFSGLTIANKGNVTLEGNDLFIRRNLDFEYGSLILNNRNAVLAPNATITGFDNHKFVVTGSGTTGGFLVRHSSGQQLPDLVFPIGVSTTSYTPASINYKGAAQNLKVRVFENVYEKALYGSQDNINNVPRTWNVSFDTNDLSAVLSINTQHSASEEGTQFAINRQLSFISRFSPTIGVWDKIPASGFSTGDLTSGSAVPNTYINTRKAINGVTLNEFFAKSVIKTSGLLGLRIPQGISPNNDGLNEKFVVENLNFGDKVRLDIYDRWQSLVYKEGNYKNTFDGTGNQGSWINRDLPDGTYYYILNVNNEKPITGFLIINR